MKDEKRIEIISKLLEATKELNGEFQEGWEEDIEQGEKLIKNLKAELKFKNRNNGSFDV